MALDTSGTRSSSGIPYFDVSSRSFACVACQSALPIVLAAVIGVFPIRLHVPLAVSFGRFLLGVAQILQNGPSEKRGLER